MVGYGVHLPLDRYQSQGDGMTVPWERMAVDVTAWAPPCMPRGKRRYLPAATGRPPGEELPQTSPEVVAALQRRGGACPRCGRKTPATWTSVSFWRTSVIGVPMKFYSPKLFE